MNFMMTWDIFGGVAVALSIIIIFFVFFIIFLDWQEQKRRERMRNYVFIIEKDGDED